MDIKSNTNIPGSSDLAVDKARNLQRQNPATDGLSQKQRLLKRCPRILKRWLSA
jgi:hypothetical protein